MEAVPFLGFAPDILHANDWQTGLLPVYLRNSIKTGRPIKNCVRYSPSTILPIRAFFRSQQYFQTGLDNRLFNQHRLEYYGQLNFLKAGIVFAELDQHRQPNLWQEIRTTYFGCGLEGVLTDGANGSAASSTASTTIAGTPRPTRSWPPLRHRHGREGQAALQGRPAALFPSAAESRRRRCWR